MSRPCTFCTNGRRSATVYSEVLDRQGNKIKTVPQQIDKQCESCKGKGVKER